MKIVIENHVPYIKGIFEPVADTLYLPAGEITRDVMRDADALITRTRTRCDASLLEGSGCRIVATATIGTDHIDLDWCRRNGVEVANAPGCNAPAVAQYVLASVATLFGGDLRGKTIGIVGVGHVGSIVERWAGGLGMSVLLCDPPRAEAEGSDGFVSLDEIASECDVITFHTPMTRTGNHPTFHLADRLFFNSLRRRPVVINSARGQATDTVAWIEAIDRGLVSHSVVDCWEGEPAISSELLRRADIATPHIAGYSEAGKIRATIAVVEAVSRNLSLGVAFNGLVPPDAPARVTVGSLLSTYDPLADTRELKNNSGLFEQLRNNYNLRKEPLA